MPTSKEEKKRIVEKSEIHHTECLFYMDLPGEGEASAAERAVVEYDSMSDGTKVYTHIGVPVSFRGTGLSQRLAEYSFDYALQRDWRVKVTCTWMTGVLQ